MFIAIEIVCYANMICICVCNAAAARHGPSPLRGHVVATLESLNWHGAGSTARVLVLG